MFAEEGHISLCEIRHTVLKCVHKVHSIKYTAVVAIGLERRVSAAVSPCSQVLEAKETLLKLRGVVWSCHKCSRLVAKPLAEHHNDSVTGLERTPFGGVHMQDNAFIKKKERAIPVGT